MNNKQTAYVLARLGLGLDIAMHGLVRLPILHTFVNGMMKEFQNTVLPQQLVWTYATALPFAELGVGLLLMAGLFTRTALVAGVLVMFTLMFGTALLQNWNGLGLQLGYTLYYALLLYVADFNVLAMDDLVAKRRAYR